jgi:pentatricopeptide repeat protein
MYGKCGSIEDALHIFDIIQQRDLISWSAMVSVYAKHGQDESSFHMFRSMQEEGILPNRVTFISILSASAHSMSVEEGKRIHAQIIRCDGDVVLKTALVNFYGKCSKSNDARAVFETITNRDVISWNAIITASVHDNRGQSVFQLFNQMRSGGFRPDRVTFTSMIDACANHFLLAEGMILHAHIMEEDFYQDIVVATGLFDMYGRCGSIEDSCKVFKQIPNRNVITWNAMIAVYGQHGLGKEAIHVFTEMEKEGVATDNITFISVVDACARLSTPSEGQRMHSYTITKGLDSDRAIGNALINMYGKHERIDDAQCVFDKMMDWDVVTWTSMITIYSQEGRSREALRIFEKMRDAKVKPDKVAFISGLAACTNHMAMADGKQMHAYIIDSGVEMDINMGNALVTMYAKCGNVGAALEIFNEMPDQDLISWNAVITAFAQHGLGREAIQLCHRMCRKGFSPSKITFVGVLTACSHAGLIDEGGCFFRCMDEYKGIELDVDHQDCMIDLYGRSGCLLEAEGLINRMPFQPTALSCLALLGSCKLVSDINRGECIARMLYELDPSNAAPYVMLSNIYVAAGKEADFNDVLVIDDVFDVRQQHDILDWELQSPVFI